MFVSTKIDKKHLNYNVSIIYLRGSELPESTESGMLLV
jgi:hypothetical protein